MTLNAYDYAELVAVSNDMLDDSGADVIPFIGEQVGRASRPGSSVSRTSRFRLVGPAGCQGAEAVGGAERSPPAVR
jgi:hypothetical protein